MIVFYILIIKKYSKKNCIIINFTFEFLFYCKITSSRLRVVSHIQNFGDLLWRCRISSGRCDTRTREMRSSATGDVLSPWEMHIPHTRCRISRVWVLRLPLEMRHLHRRSLKFWICDTAAFVGYQLIQFLVTVKLDDIVIVSSINKYYFKINSSKFQSTKNSSDTIKWWKSKKKDFIEEIFEFIIIIFFFDLVKFTSISIISNMKNQYEWINDYL
jgi:hypothetical protein